MTEEKYFKDTNLDINVPVVYLDNGKPAPYYVLTDPISSSAAAHWSCIHDLNECLEYISLLKEMIPRTDLPEILKKGIYVSTVITYMKCYNEGSRLLKLDYNQVFKDQDPALLSLHCKVRDLRNKNFAHASEGTLESEKAILYFDPRAIDENHIESKINVNKLSYAHDTESFQELISISKSYIERRIEKLIPKFRQNVLEMNLIELYKKSKTPDPTKIF